MKLLGFGLVLLVICVSLSTAVQNLSAQDSPIDLSKIPSDLITENESSTVIDIAPAPDKFNPLLHNSGPIENTIVCDVSNLNGESVLCSGTAKNDKMVGTSKSDTIDSLEGDDFILGGKGNDFLSAGDGRDQVNGGPGDDRIYSGNGEDLIFAGSGNDIVSTWAQSLNKSEDIPYKDIIDCGPGDDRIYADDIDVYKNCEMVNDINIGFESESRLPPVGLLP